MTSGASRGGVAPILERGPIADLVRAARWDEALARLYAERDDRAGDGAIADAIRVVRERALSHGMERIGSLDAVPRRTGAAASLGQDEQYVLGLVDGARSAEELLDVSTLGRHRTVRALAALIERAVVSVERATRASGIAPSPGAAKYVVVADGHGPSAALTRTMLRLALGAGAQLETVATSVDLVAAASKQRPDLVVTELMLPGGDAIAALRAIRKSAGGSVPAIVIAARMELEYASGRAPERCAVLARPIEKSALIEALSGIGIARKGA